LIITVVAFVWLSVENDKRGNPVLDDNLVKVLVPLIGGAFTLLVVFAQRSIGAIKHQVQNSHTTNMRDEQDKQTDVLLEIRMKLARLESVPAEIGWIRRDVGLLRGDISQQRQDFSQHLKEAGEWREDIEDTIEGHHKKEIEE
jgi:hypothetical protein